MSGLSQEHISYLIASLIGAVVLVIAGFMVYAIDGQGVSFDYWITHPVRFGAYGWILLGLFLGSGIRYLSRSR